MLNIQSWYKLLLNPILVTLSCAFIGGASFAAPSTEGIQVYQKNVHLSPEHKQKLADDITRYRNADNLWDALREEFTLPHYENNPAVQAKIEWFMNNQDFLLRSASRAAPYLYYISQQLKKRHLPAELVLLPIIESGYNPFSISNMGASGIWQLMPQTASGLGVRHDLQYDGRRDVVASTRAALNYLAYLQSFFDGNWLYAIAAYNTGEGNVLSAIKRNIRAGVDTDFWSLPVAQQTKDYVPSLLALAVIISHPDQYPIYFPPVRNAPYLGQVDVGTKISLKYAASLAGISYKKVTQLNPGYSRAATSSKGQYKLILPIENVAQFTENLALAFNKQPQVNWMHYKVKSGDTLASIATKFDTTAGAIRKLNHINKKGLNRGNTLLIPTSNESPGETEDEAIAEEKIASTKTIKSTKQHENPIILSARTDNEDSSFDLSNATDNYSLKPGDTIYMVRKNDTVDGIAQRFHINPNALRTANNLENQTVHPGKQIIIPTHMRNDAEEIKPGDTIYMVRRGDTIEKVAQRFHTTSSEIRLANLMMNNSVHEGDRLIVPTHMRG